MDSNFTKISEHQLRKKKVINKRYFSYSNKGSVRVFDKQNQLNIDMSVPIMNIQSYKDGIFLCKDARKQFVYLDTTGVQQFYTSFNLASEFFDNISVTKSMGQFNLMDKEGGLVNSFFHYYKVEPLTSNLYKAYANQKHGIVNNKGQVLISAEYQKLELIGEDWILAYKDDSMYYYNLKDRKWLQTE